MYKEHTIYAMLIIIIIIIIIRIYSSLKEAHRPVPLDQFTKHFYRQKVLTEGAAYPELYRKPNTTTNINSGADGNYSYKDLYTTNNVQADVVSPLHYTQVSLEETKGTSSTSHVHSPATSAGGASATSAAAARYTHMTASDVDVKRVEDEVEDPPELLKEYYEAYVLPLSHYTATTTSSTTTAGGPAGGSDGRDRGVHDCDVSQA